MNIDNIYCLIKYVKDFSPKGLTIVSFVTWSYLNVDYIDTGRDIGLDSLIKIW